MNTTRREISIGVDGRRHLIRGEGPAGSGVAYTMRDGDALANLEVWLPDAALDILEGFLRRSLPRSASVSDPDVLLRVAGLLAEFPEGLRLGASGFTTVCEQAGIAYDRRLADDRLIEPVDRWCPILGDHLPGGTARSLGVRFSPPRDGSEPSPRDLAVTFEETYREPDGDRLYRYDISLAYTSLPVAMADDAPVATRRDLEDRLVAYLARLVGWGILGGPHLPGHGRDLLAARFRDLGIAHRVGGLPRFATLLSGPASEPGVECTLQLSTETHQPSPNVMFIEVHERTGPARQRDQSRVVVPAESIPLLVAYLIEVVRVVPPPAAAGSRPEARLLACLHAAVARGLLASGAPRRAMRDQVARWLTAAGAAHTVLDHSRRELTLHRHQPVPDHVFTLQLLLDPADPGQGITFTERHVFRARPGHDRHERHYRLRTDYGSLADLVELFEARSGRNPAPTEVLEDRLVGAVAALAARGDLADGLPPGENHDRIASWLAEAAVPVEAADEARVDVD